MTQTNGHRKGITEIGPGKFRLRVGAGWNPERGRYVDHSRTFKGTPAAAEKEWQRLKVAVGSGAVTAGDREPVRDFLARYIDHKVTIGQLRAKTAATYRGYVSRDVTPCIGTKKIGDIRPRDVQGVLNAASKKGLSPRSVRQIHAVLHGAFRWAVQTNVLTRNPADGATPPKLETPTLVLPKTADVARLIAAIGETFRAPLTIAAYTGLRRGEVLGLTWSALNLEDSPPTLRIQGTLQRANGELVLLPPKTDRSRRTVPLPASVAEMLRAVRTEQVERRLLVGPAWQGGDYVFDRGDGHPVDPDTFGKAFRRARAAAGLEGIRLHDLRHHFATMLVESGTNARVVSDLLGHSPVSFTMMTYFHPDQETAVAAIDAAESMLGPALGS
jgi:integrase